MVIYSGYSPIWYKQYQGSPGEYYLLLFVKHVPVLLGLDKSNTYWVLLRFSFCLKVSESSRDVFHISSLQGSPFPGSTHIPNFTLCFLASFTREWKAIWKFFLFTSQSPSPASSLFRYLFPNQPSSKRKTST